MKIAIFRLFYEIKIRGCGGETGIRTLDRLAPMPVFKTGAFNHSAISPCLWK